MVKTKDTQSWQALGQRVAYGLLVCFAMVVLVVTGLYAPIETMVMNIGAPFLKVGTQVVSVVLVPARSVFSGVNRQERIRELSAETSLLHARLAELEHVERENQALRSILENSNRTLQEARVTSPVLSLSYPAISSGSEVGILQNQAIVISGTLVGVVAEVFPTQSRITLLSNQAVSPILVRTESGVEGVIFGDGKNVVMHHIPREIQVTEGERVFTIGQQGIQKNMFVGKIGRITADPSAPTKEAVIDQYVSFFDSVLVEVW